MDTSVSVLAEIPDDLHQSLTTYLEKHPNWDLDRVFSAALSLFLLQNESGYGTERSSNYQACARVYLDTLLQHAE